MNGHGGELALAALARFGVTELFTLSGGHIFPLYDAAVKRQDVRIVDVRHEQTATFAAEGMAKLTRRPGVAVLTAGPGVTNGISAVTTAQFNGSPLVVLGGRAPQDRWGVGLAAGVRPRAGVRADHEAGEDGHGRRANREGGRRRRSPPRSRPHRGPVFVDFPLDVVFATARPRSPTPSSARPDPTPTRSREAAALIAAAERPALIAGHRRLLGRRVGRAARAASRSCGCRRS